MRASFAATLVAGTLTLAACAPAEDSARTTPATSAPAGTAADAGTRLVVTVVDGSGTSVTSTLTCAPAGGDVGDPAAACAAVEAAGVDGFAPPPPDAVCSTVYGGPQTATVTGTVDGSPVAATLTRTNGCAIDRWDALAPLLPPVSADI